MLSDVKELEGLWAKLEWAESQILKLNDEWRRIEEKDHPIQHHEDPATGDRVYCLAHSWDAPLHIPLMAGDAIHNLRCALDHAAYRMVSAFTKGSGPFGELYFPIAQSPSKFAEKLDKAAKFKHVSRLGSEAIKAIEAIEPYEGGVGETLWHLHRLDIIDKHNLLLTTGSINKSHSMPPSQVAHVKAQFLGISETSGFTPAVDARAFLINSQSPFPLKAGDVLARIPKSEIDENIHFTFDVAFAEIVKGKPIVDTLYGMAGSVRTILRDFDNLDLFD